VNAFIFESILVLYHLVQEHVKEGYAVHFITATYTFHFQLFSTHMSLGLSTYVSTGRRVEEAMHMHLVLKVHKQ
jgi:hypothetical protein